MLSFVMRGTYNGKESFDFYTPSFVCSSWNDTDSLVLLANKEFAKYFPHQPPDKWEVIPEHFISLHKSDNHKDNNGKVYGQS